jgi:hypothetical protein
MIELFGGWQSYQSAPAQVVEEQRLVWLARRKAESEQATSTPTITP